MIAPILILVAIALQSTGEVLYGTFLTGVSTPLFVFLGICQTAVVFLAITRLRMPREGRGLMLLANVWTAICFISVFYALKYLPPVICTSIEIAMSLLVAIALTAVQKRAWPRKARILACAGILGGAALLSWAEILLLAPESSDTLMWGAVLASTATGAAGALLIGTFKKLGALGWSSTAVLGHRFYLTIAVTLAWLPLESAAMPLPSGGTLLVVAAIGAVAILVPLLLLQLAIRRTDELTILICMSAQPILSFMVAMPSPAYDWNLLTLVGVLVVTAFVGLDMVQQHRRAPLPLVRYLSQRRDGP